MSGKRKTKAKRETIEVKLMISMNTRDSVYREEIVEVIADDWAEMSESNREAYMKDELEKVILWDYKELEGDQS